jgi:hypothetical protein
MKKKYQDMTADELAEATRDLDRPNAIDRTRPLNAAERAADQRARRRSGRPKVGRGAERINITVERRLLERADQAARKRKIGRSELIAEGLLLALAEHK